LRKDNEVTTLIAIFTVQTNEMKSYRTNWLVILLLTGLIYSNINKTIAQPAPDENFCVVSARLIYGDSVCIVGGHGPLEFYWDDGDPENYFAWILPGGMLAVRYTPPGYPLRCLGGSVHVGDGSYPEGADFIGKEMRIYIFDDDGPDNLPGTVLDSVTITVENYNWVKFGELDAVIEEGDFYIGVEQLFSPPNSAPVGIDEENPILFKSYTKMAGGNWQHSSYNDFMIRAYVCGIQNVPYDLGPKDYFWYELSRMSDFNPENGESPEDGTLTIIDSLPYFYYQETTFYALSPGYYAYAVRIIKDDTATTGWYYTNAVERLPLSVEEVEFLAFVAEITPNPIVDNIIIKSFHTIHSVSILNTCGQKVWLKTFNQKQVSFSMNSLPNGIYFVRVKTKNGQVLKKVLKL